ncbi:hypothetical protein DSCOOX_01010 [Desulfosarcina ovata subsp. ovata]|uniref:Uncharacterized protein n=1 Tax=Desulfosarcina ovata subsp. ovata TaxID=2752305 RepID=A0A5K8A397_9BACT|nr:hypothetical protein DSCOOX_01010 [Desulfosarcina ovata subsp. ovata]
MSKEMVIDFNEDKSEIDPFSGFMPQCDSSREAREWASRVSTYTSFPLRNKVLANAWPT